MRDHRRFAVALRGGRARIPVAGSGPELILVRAPGRSGRRPAAITWRPAITVGLNVTAPLTVVQRVARSTAPQTGSSTTTTIRTPGTSATPGRPPSITAPGPDISSRPPSTPAVVVLSARPASKAVSLAAARLVLHSHISRAEDRLAGPVEQVVIRPAAEIAPSATTVAGSGILHGVGDPAPFGAPRAVSAPEPDLGRITDHVLAAIDHRLIAATERMGR